MVNVGFLVSSDWLEFGYSETLYSWFSTICYRLENKEWGSRFPIVMNKLYCDEKNGVPYGDLEEFKNELSIIQKEFFKLAPKDAIWSFEDNILEIPQNMPNINYDVKDLVDFYVNLRSKNIFELLEIIVTDDMPFYKTNCRIVAERDFLTIPKI